MAEPPGSVGGDALAGTPEENTITYNATSVDGKGKQWQRALEWLEEMRPHSFQADAQADVITYSATISACRSGKQWRAPWSR